MKSYFELSKIVTIVTIIVTICTSINSIQTKNKNFQAIDVNEADCRSLPTYLNRKVFLHCNERSWNDCLFMMRVVLRLSMYLLYARQRKPIMEWVPKRRPILLPRIKTLILERVPWVQEFRPQIYTDNGMHADWWNIAAKAVHREQWKGLPGIAAGWVP